MKFIDNIINKIGHDKVIHFSQAGWLTQIGGLFGLIGTIVAPIAVMLFGFLKEKYLDDTFKTAKTDVMNIYTDKPYILELIKFFKFRQEKALKHY